MQRKYLFGRGTGGENKIKPSPLISFILRSANPVKILAYGTALSKEVRLLLFPNQILKNIFKGCTSTADIEQFSHRNYSQKGRWGHPGLLKKANGNCKKCQRCDNFLH